MTDGVAVPRPDGASQPTPVPIVVVCGVAGGGKTTVGRLAAARLGVPFFDADDAHSDDARAAMRAGRPLTDADRAPWLDRLARHLAAWHADGCGGVLACSALRRAHRDRLAEAAPGARFVLLTAPPDVLRERLRSRRGHFFPAALLGSQIATLEGSAGLPVLDTHALDPAAAADAVARLARG